MNSNPRHFAIVPAAGTSQRMGRPKLMLPLDGQPLIAVTLAAWRRSRVDRVLIVIRPDDEPLAMAAASAGAEVVQPATPPPDMKASIQAALRHIQTNYQPHDNDAFLVAPADMPRLSPAIINRLIELHAPKSDCILVPLIAGTRGHPVLFPWPLVDRVFALTDHEGLNTLVDRSNAVLVRCDDLVAPDDVPFTDVDTPADLERLNQPPRFR